MREACVQRGRDKADRRLYDGSGDGQTHRGKAGWRDSAHLVPATNEASVVEEVEGEVVVR